VQAAGLRAAVERLDAAALRRDDPQGTYLPLFEALNWVASLDDRIGAIWRPDGGKDPIGTAWRERVGSGPRITALDWVRNLVHHQWADALRLDPSGHGLYPSQDLYPSDDLYPLPDHAWVWRDARELPARRARRKKGQGPGADGAETYNTHLAGRSAVGTLTEILPDFERVAGWLEPPRPPRADAGI
jgi:hypothetical protein